MIEPRVRRAFEAMTVIGKGDPGALAIGLRRGITGLGMRALAAKTLHTAVLAPERLTDVYDNAAAGWLLRPVHPPRLPRQPEGPLKLSPAFWDSFWALVDTPVEARRKTPFTVQAATLAGLLPAELNARVAEAALDFPGVGAAAAGGIPGRFEKADLARCPVDSLGGEFYRRVMRRPGDLEIIDRTVLRLDELPYPLEYVNTRILQCHTLWRIVSGYGDTMFDDLGLAAFQMGQFGHHYSALVIGLTLSVAALQRPPGVEFLLDVIFEGWSHGRDSTPLLGVEWEALWDQPVATVRERLNLKPRKRHIMDPAPEPLTGKAEASSAWLSGLVPEPGPSS